MKKIIKLFAVPLALCLVTAFTFSEAAAMPQGEQTNSQLTMRGDGHPGHPGYRQPNRHPGWQHNRRPVWHHNRHHCRRIVTYTRSCRVFSNCVVRNGQRICHPIKRCHRYPVYRTQCWR
jgi:hypothetical protein